MVDVGLQGEVAGIEHLDHRIGVVALIGLGARWNEEGVAFAPDRQRWHLGVAKELLECRIQLEVVLIIKEQVELDVLVAGPLQQKRVQMVRLGCDHLGMTHALHILPARAFQMQDGILDHLAIGGRRVGPVLADRRPRIPQTFEIRIAVLRNNRAHPIRVSQRQAQASGGAVVEEIHRITLESQYIDKLAQRLADRIEGVDVVTFSRHFGEAESGQVRRDEAVFVRQQRDQLAELVRRAGKAVQQQQYRRVDSAGFAIEHLDAVGFDEFVGNVGVSGSGHCSLIL
ncbi:hypothetical protein D3C76_1076370 [compost metagenome]